MIKNILAETTEYDFKIQDKTKKIYGYNESYAPQFVSSKNEFKVVLMNINYKLKNITDKKSVIKKAINIQN